MYLYAPPQLAPKTVSQYEKSQTTDNSTLNKISQQRVSTYCWHLGTTKSTSVFRGATPDQTQLHQQNGSPSFRHFPQCHLPPESTLPKCTQPQTIIWQRFTARSLHFLCTCESNMETLSFSQLNKKQNRNGSSSSNSSSIGHQ